MLNLVVCFLLLWRDFAKLTRQLHSMTKKVCIVLMFYQRFHLHILKISIHSTIYFPKVTNIKERETTLVLSRFYNRLWNEITESTSCFFRLHHQVSGEKGQPKPGITFRFWSFHLILCCWVLYRLSDLLIVSPGWHTKPVTWRSSETVKRKCTCSGSNKQYKDIKKTVCPWFVGCSNKWDRVKHHWNKQSLIIPIWKCIIPNPCILITF